MKKSDTVRYSAEQVTARIGRGEDRTNWGKVDAITGVRLAESILADVDDEQAAPEWTRAVVGIPATKET
jgi:hypothetical protein